MQDLFPWDLIVDKYLKMLFLILIITLGKNTYFSWVPFLKYGCCHLFRLIFSQLMCTLGSYTENRDPDLIQSGEEPQH